MASNPTYLLERLTYANIQTNIKVLYFIAVKAALWYVDRDSSFVVTDKNKLIFWRSCQQEADTKVDFKANFQLIQTPPKSRDEHSSVAQEH